MTLLGIRNQEIFVHFEKVGHCAPALVIDIVKPSFFPYPPCMATHCTHTTEKHITLPTHNTHHTTRRRRCRGRASTSTCCHRRCPTGDGGPRSEGGSNAGRRKGDQGIAVAVTAALAQFAHLLTRGARAGAELTASYSRVSMPHAGPRWCHGRSRGHGGCDVRSLNIVRCSHNELPDSFNGYVRT